MNVLSCMYESGQTMAIAVKGNCGRKPLAED